MSKFTTEEIQEIASRKGLVILNPGEYKSLEETNLEFQCAEGHKFVSNLKTVRDLATFKCPKCLGGEAKYSRKPPKKSGHRVVGFDQATQNFGISIYDDGKLVYFDVIRFIGDSEQRLTNIAKFIGEICIEWEPDFVCFEDIQLQGGQNGYITFKVLAELLGVVKVMLTANGIKHNCVLNKTWQAYFGIGGKDRATQKANVIKKVKELFDISVSDDIADAILIGRYWVAQEESKKNTLF